MPRRASYRPAPLLVEVVLQTAAMQQRAQPGEHLGLLGRATPGAYRLLQLAAAGPILSTGRAAPHGGSGNPILSETC
jgi:hypothetical protein